MWISLFGLAAGVLVAPAAAFAKRGGKVEVVGENDNAKKKTKSAAEIKGYDKSAVKGGPGIQYRPEKQCADPKNCTPEELACGCEKKKKFCDSKWGDSCPYLPKNGGAKGGYRYCEQMWLECCHCVVKVSKPIPTPPLAAPPPAYVPPPEGCEKLPTWELRNACRKLGLGGNK
jgi:hypothetical protein